MQTHCKHNSTPRPAATLRRIASTLIFALTLSACASTTPSSEQATKAPTPIVRTATFCDNAKPLSWDAKDTDETIREIKAHNGKGADLCGWRTK